MAYAIPVEINYIGWIYTSSNTLDSPKKITLAIKESKKIPSRNNSEP